MKKVVLDRILAVVAGGMCLWNSGLGEVVTKYTTTSEPVVRTGCYVPNSGNMKTKDGVSFGWLYDNGLVPVDANGMATSMADFENAVNEDPDEDGFTNYEEYIAGTDPNDPDSFLRTQIKHSSQGMVVGPEKTVSGRVYDVYSTSNLVEKMKWAGSFRYPAEGLVIKKPTRGFYKMTVKLDE